MFYSLNFVKCVITQRDQNLQRRIWRITSFKLKRNGIAKIYFPFPSPAGLRSSVDCIAGKTRRNLSSKSSRSDLRASACRVASNQSLELLQRFSKNASMPPAAIISFLLRQRYSVGKAILVVAADKWRLCACARDAFPPGNCKYIYVECPRQPPCGHGPN